MKRIFLLCLLAGATPGLTLAQDPDADTRRDIARTDVGPTTGSQEFSISGVGDSDQDFDRTNLNVSGEWGWYFTDRTLFGVRQGLTWIDSGDDSDWNGSTRAYTNFHFGASNWRPFLGASLGGVYGDRVTDSGFGGLEGGLKYYVQAETFLLGRVEYQWFFDNADEVDDAFDDGAFVYNIGIGFNF
ncbi:MAG: hypothetical protein WED00_09230 [Aquisalimonadaceae bacterium]